MKMRFEKAHAITIAFVISALPSCSGAADDNSYYDVRAIVTTGKEGSDGNVSLCWTMSGAQTCRDLSSSHNDFESGATGTYDLSLNPRVAHGTPFTGFVIKYTTGLSVGDTWEAAGLRVSRYYGDGTEELICNSTFDQILSNTNTLTPPGCP